MSIYSDWMNKAFTKDGHGVEEIWNDYLPREQKIYEYIIGEKVTEIKGTVKELAERFDVPCDYIVAFVDGINEVIEKPYEMEELTEDSVIELNIGFEKLYKKMIEYKAEHLYTLPQWNDVFTPEKQKELYIEQRNSRTIVKGEKIGRNDPCPCGSGKKYKKCCGAN